MSHWPVASHHAARIDSISIFAAGRDAARHDGAMRHIVNLALQWCYIPFQYRTLEHLHHFRGEK